MAKISYNNSYTMKQRIGIDYDFLFHALPGNYLVMQADDPDFTIVEVSDSLCDVVGIDRSDMLNKPLTAVFPESSNSDSKEGTRSLLASIRRCIASTKPDTGGVIRYDVQDADGQFMRRLWRTTHFPVVRRGKVSGVILSTQEVTEAFDHDEYTRQRLEYLEHLVLINKSKDEFISVASHQLRTPATGVKQYLAMLLDNLFGALNDEQRDLVQRAYDSNERQLKIVTDLLKVAQVDSGKLVLHTEPVDVNMLTHSVLQEFASVFKQRSQSLEFRGTKQPAIVEIDKDIIRMVIENLVDNASKYTDLDGRLVVSVRQNKSEVDIAIKDEGVGIPKERRGMLFEKFSRIHNRLSTKVGGTGLGLYWAKKSVELHGGNIVYEPARPRGSVFTIKLMKNVNIFTPNKQEGRV